MRYQQNVACLMSYEHNYIRIFPEYDELPFICIPRNDREYYIFNKETQEITQEALILSESMEFQVTAHPGQIFMIVNCFDAQQLQAMEMKTRNPLWINNMKFPLYILWEDFSYLIYLQVQDFQSLVESNRVVFFPDCGADFTVYFSDPQSLIPQLLIGHSEIAKKRLDDIVVERKQSNDEKLSFIRDMASKYDRRYYSELFAGDVSNIRILLYTSRFTRVVQHSTRDFMKACQEHGIICELLIEKTDIHQASEQALVDKIAQFQPNVIFRINFFKSDFKVVPENMLFLTWMQDPGGQIYSAAHAQKFGWNDFSLALPEWLKAMIKTGFDPSRLSPQILPFNESVFYPRRLSESEQQLYESNIALPSNYNMPSDALANLISVLCEQIPVSSDQSKIKNLIIRCLIQIYDTFRSQIEEGILIASNEQCGKTILEILSALGLNLTNDQVYYIAEEFYQKICYGIHRRTTLKWVVDAGLELKLWGRDWDKDNLLKNYGKGVLAHGEELAKMYSATKIVLATFSHYTGHFRVFEALACGALPMLRYVPEDCDLANFRDKFKENEHFVFYYGKQDLIDKLNYYLTNEEERQRIVMNGCKMALQSATYTNAVEDFLHLVRRNFE